MIDTYLSSEIVSPDMLTLFLQIISTAIIIGIVAGLFVRATWWLWGKL